MKRTEKYLNWEYTVETKITHLEIESPNTGNITLKSELVNYSLESMPLETDEELVINLFIKWFKQKATEQYSLLYTTKSDDL